MRRRVPRAPLCLIGACVLAGCRGGAGTETEPAVPPGDRGGLPRVEGAGAVNGIEVRSWTIDPLGAPLASRLASYEVGLERAGEGLPPEVVRVWRDHGFRLVEIPSALVDELESSLPHVDAVRRVWLGQPTRWTDLAARALPSDGGALGGRPVPVRAAIGVRSWVEPGLRRRPVRVELALTGEPLKGENTRPEVLRDLLVGHRLAPGSALAIVPASPDEVWFPDEPESSEATRDDEPDAAGPDPAAAPPAPSGVAPLAPPGVDEGAPAPPEAAGPREPLPRSLGESMLMAGSRIRSVPARAAREVLVIVPASR